ncbi:MAG: hypothetical protein H7Y89_05615 [Steroidobacteraceae bacterium]|nr:hypothetical protein [Steroidobacteraceae bacterium]
MRIDVDLREIEANEISVLADARRTEDGAQLAQVPAQLGARISGRLAEHCAEP